MRLLGTLMAFGLSASQLGVICLYRAQAAYQAQAYRSVLKRYSEYCVGLLPSGYGMCSSMSYQRPCHLRGFMRRFKLSRRPQVALVRQTMVENGVDVSISVSTVDAFQVCFLLQARIHPTLSKPY